MTQDRDEIAGNVLWATLLLAVSLWFAVALFEYLWFNTDARDFLSVLVVRDDPQELVLRLIFTSAVLLGGFTVSRVLLRVARLEHTAREQEQLVRDLLNSTAEAILGVNPQGVCTFANPACVRMLGYRSADDLVGRDIHRLTHYKRLDGSPYPADECPMNRTLKLGHDARVDDEVLWRADGESLPVEYWSFPVRRDGEITGAMVTFLDITERRRVEEERREVEAHLRQKQKLEAIGTLAGGIAHEINNPINGIMNYAQLIQERLDCGSPLREFAEEISRETERVATIVRNVLSFARQEKSAHSPASIADIVSDTVSLVRTIIRRDQIALEVDLPEDLPKINCRSQQIQQVLMNLLTNARDALNDRYPEHDPDKVMTVTVRLVEKEGQRWIRSTVEDHGQGVPDEIRGRLFDPFFTTKDRTSGTGLGLSISHGIVQDHRGELWMECEADRYTRFHLDLPVDNGRTQGGARAGTE